MCPSEYLVGVHLKLGMALYIICGSMFLYIYVYVYIYMYICISGNQPLVVTNPGYPARNICMYVCIYIYIHII